MVIAVQSGLPHLREYLRQQGYDVITLGEHSCEADMVLYEASASVSPFSAHHHSIHPHVSFFNVQGLSFPEILNLIQSGQGEKIF